MQLPQLKTSLNNLIRHSTKSVSVADVSLPHLTVTRVRTEILPTVQPYRMSVAELQTYQAYTQPFSKDYAEKLKKLKEQERLSDCLDCIDYMLNNKVRLEQEAMLT